MQCVDDGVPLSPGFRRDTRGQARMRVDQIRLDLFVYPAESADRTCTERFVGDPWHFDDLGIERAQERRQRGIFWDNDRMVKLVAIGPSHKIQKHFSRAADIRICDYI